jgi:3-(3-hydroxy-phenyl)propionate hydroxylase
VITTTPPRADQRAVIDTRGARSVVADPGSPLAAWLSHGRAHAAIVRPDGTVMAAGRNLDTVLRNLPTFRPQEPR